MMQDLRAGPWLVLSLAILVAACDTASVSVDSNRQGFDSEIKVPPRNQVSYMRP